MKQKAGETRIPGRERMTPAGVDEEWNGSETKMNRACGPAALQVQVQRVGLLPDRATLLTV
jgi:hypothetical protein